MMMEQQQQLPVDILLVENCPQQIQHVRHALNVGKFVNRLHTVGNGNEAIAYLRRAEPYQDVPRPSLVLLDLDLPANGGHDVLEATRTDAKLRSIPVVVLTPSGPGGIPFDYESVAAHYYIGKPFDLPQFIDAVQWIDTISLMAVNTVQPA